MSKESKLSYERRELIRPVELDLFDPESELNKQARTVVSLLRRSLAKGESLDFSLPFEAKPYFECKVSGPGAIDAKIAYVNKRNGRTLLHREEVSIAYDFLSVDRPKEFSVALFRKEISRIDFSLNVDRLDVRDPKPIRIDYSSGGILLDGAKITSWDKKP